MATRYHDLTGKTYGRLTVLGYVESRKHRAYWRCLCECGGEKVVMSAALTNALTKSCGCLAKEINAKRCTKHGASTYSGYGSWKAMISRCHNPDDRDYPHYGGRGIFVSERWHDVSAFAEDMGEKLPGQSIDRLDPEKGYSPDNCRWTDAKGQGENKRNNVKVMFNGEMKHIAAIWREAGMRESTFYHRINSGMTHEEAVRLPVKRKNELVTINGKSMTIKQWAEASGIKYATLRYRIARGLKGGDLIAPVNPV